MKKIIFQIIATATLCLASHFISKPYAYWEVDIPTPFIFFGCLLFFFGPYTKEGPPMTFRMSRSTSTIGWKIFGIASWGLGVACYLLNRFYRP